MAGSSASFNAITFRTQIRAAMTMGLPGAVEDRATFRWKVNSTYAIQDPTHHPYSFAATPLTQSTHADVQIPVAVQYGTAMDTLNELGTFDTTKAVLTILDTDYERVRGASYVLLAGSVYVIHFVIPTGLFDVTVYEVHTESLDQGA